MRRDLTVLIVGSGAREHALYRTIEQSPLVRRVLCTPGNGGIPARDRRDIKDSDFGGIFKLIEEEGVNLLVIGPEGPLVAGLVDSIEEFGIDVVAFGPQKGAAMLEGSKIFTKTYCGYWHIPTAPFEFTDDYDMAERIIKRTGFRVIKADGLCGGKGVTVADSEAEALEAAYQLLVKRTQGDAGARILIEERLEGRECSVMAFCDGENAVLLPPARDFKRAHDGNTGPNTGGMGSYSPLPDVDDALLDEIKEQIILPTVRGMKNLSCLYYGLLYAGIMLTKDGPKLLEYNVRFGDPETQVVLPRLESDIVPYMLASCKRGGLSKLGPLQVKPDGAVCTVLVSQGYPDKYETGFPITGVEEAERDALVFHAGTKQTSELVTSGGRVMSCVALGDTFEAARQRSLRAAGMIGFENKFNRTDIAANV